MRRAPVGLRGWLANSRSRIDIRSRLASSRTRIAASWRDAQSTAGRFTQALATAVSSRASETAPRLTRLEPFGAIIQLVWPRALIFVDRERAKHLGIIPAAGDDIWRDPRQNGVIGRSILSAPLEAHLQLTNRCDAGCQGCYTGATARGLANEWGFDEWRRAIDELAARGVFHLALGGGESAVLPWLGDIAAYARERGLVPNLTTSGLSGLERVLSCAHLFGQINVSIDGLDEGYAAVRGFDGFAAADRAVTKLRARKAEVGINVVITRKNFAQIDALFAYARKRRLNEIELLRFKPAGRGTRSFAALTCSDAQHRRFLPEVLAACRRHRVRARVDCSYTPMLAHHRPDPALLASLAVYGCTGGDFLIGVKASGVMSACSFAKPPPGRPTVDQIGTYWTQTDAFEAFRSWRTAEQPCQSCDYHDLCRGGCKVVSRHVLGDARRPDPECPRVIDWHQQHDQAPPQRRLPVLD